MTALLTQLVLLGLLASATPLGIGAVLIVSRGGTRPRNGLALALGWATVMATVAIVAATVLHDWVRPAHTPSRTLALVEIGIGVLLVVGGFAWRVRPQRPKDPTKRTLQDRLGGIGPGAAFVAGLALAPYPIAFAAGSELVQTDASMSARWAALLVFCLLAISSMLAVVAALSRWPDTAQTRIERIQTWFSAHAKAIGFWLLVVIGAYLVWRGAATLART